MACGEDVQTRAGGVVVGRMMLLVACLCTELFNY